MFSARQTWVPIAESYQPFMVTANVARNSFQGTANSIRIQIYSGTPNIDWGDGNFTLVTTPGVYSKTYANNTTTKPIVINSPTSNIGFKFTDANRVIDVVDFGTIPISNASTMFANARGLTTLTTTRTPTFEGGTDASYMFSNANVFVQDISSWNMSKVSNTSYMLRGANLFNGNLGSWDMRNVSNSAYMFQSANSFNNGGSDTIKNWNVGNIVDMTGMFQGAKSFNQPVGSWTPNSVQSTASMFASANTFTNGEISSFAGWTNTTNLANTTGMFFAAYAFNQPVGEINMANVTTMAQMFQQANTFNNGGNTNISNWNTAKVSNMAVAFGAASVFNQSISNWDTGNVVSMGAMFQNAIAFDNAGSNAINNLNTSNLNNAYAMFSGANTFNQPLGDWDTSKFYLYAGEGTSADYMFFNATLFNQNLTGWCVANFSLYPPSNFGTGSGLDPAFYPVWGTCPP